MSPTWEMNTREVALTLTVLGSHWQETSGQRLCANIRSNAAFLFLLPLGSKIFIVKMLLQIITGAARIMACLIVFHGLLRLDDSRGAFPFI